MVRKISRMPMMGLTPWVAGTLLMTVLAQPAVGKQKDPSTESSGDEEETFIYDDHDQRDPFWPLVTPSGAIITHEKDLTIADLVLEGILIGSNGDNTAIINGRILKPEDTIGSFVIKNIAADSVVLQKGSQITTLKLKKED